MSQIRKRSHAYSPVVFLTLLLLINDFGPLCKIKVPYHNVIIELGYFTEKTTFCKHNNPIILISIHTI